MTLCQNRRIFMPLTACFVHECSSPAAPGFTRMPLEIRNIFIRANATIFSVPHKLPLSAGNAVREKACRPIIMVLNECLRSECRFGLTERLWILSRTSVVSFC